MRQRMEEIVETVPCREEGGRREGGGEITKVSWLRSSAEAINMPH